MILQTLLKATVLAAAATATTIPSRDTAGFRLWANTTYPDLPAEWGPAVQGLELGYRSTGACEAAVVLVPAGDGAVFRADGDTVGVANLNDEGASAGMVITPGGTATVPNDNTVELRCGEGSQGVFVSDWGLEYPAEGGPRGNGGFMACNREEGVVLSFFAWGQRPLMGCTVVQLIPTY